MRGNMLRLNFVLVLLLATRSAMASIDKVDTTELRSLVSELETTTREASSSGATSIDPQKVRKDALRTLVAVADHMHRGTKAIAGMEALLGNHVNLTNATSPWSDTDLRSGWDEVRDWGTVAGSALATYGLLAKSRGLENRQSIAAGGLCLTGAVQLLGRYFGPSKLTEKAAFLDMTVRAYDDMLAHRAHLAEIETKNTDVRVPRFQKRLETATKLADDAEAGKLPTDGVLLRELASTTEDLAEYESAVRELLTAGDQLATLAGGYLLNLDTTYRMTDPLKKEAEAVSKRIEASEGMKRTIADLQQVVGGMADFKRDHAPAIYEFFSVGIEARTAIKDAEMLIRSGRK